MDATKLIEEAEIWAREIHASAFPDGAYWGEKFAELAAALKASEERARKAEELAAANLAANKRIVELEQETDGLDDAPRTCDESRKELIDGLKTARDTLDLGKRLIQALQHERDAARAELARLTTPRPIAEAPKDSRTQIVALWMDGNEIESMDVVIWADMDDGEHPERKFWMNMAGDSVEHMTHFIPLAVLT